MGHVLDMANNSIHVTPNCVSKFKLLLAEIMSYPTVVPARLLAKLTGSLSSMWLALGCMVRLQTRSLHACLGPTLEEGWEIAIPLEHPAKAELSFWQSELDHFHGRPIWSAGPRTLQLVFTDASDSGWGGFSLMNGVEIARGEWPWTMSAAHTSSILRELLAARFALISLVSRLSGQAICLHTDNQNVVSILWNGSRNPTLHQ